MRTTLNLSEELIDKARRITGIQEKTALIHACLEAVIRRDAYHQLGKMGRTMPKLNPIPRKRASAK
ncbi:MAG: type II toxin-antitoxin system VapB family antitoxin [Bryobacteraceae bacterium]